MYHVYTIQMIYVKLNFLVDLNENRDIQNIRVRILLNVQNACNEALKYMNTFIVYEYIWLEEKECYLNRFLNECKQKCSTNDDYPEDSMSEINAKIDSFQTQVLYNITEGITISPYRTS